MDGTGFLRDYIGCGFVCVKVTADEAGRSERSSRRSGCDSDRFRPRAEAPETIGGRASDRIEHPPAPRELPRVTWPPDIAVTRTSR
jgi:hypothetical protein